MAKHLVCIISLLLWGLWSQAQTRRYDFSQPVQLGEWHFLRQPDLTKYVPMDSVLRLYGDVAEMKDTAAATFLAQPVPSVRFQAETLMSLFDDENGDEAGLALYWADNCYVQACLNNNRGTHRIVLQFRLLEHKWIMAEHHLNHRPGKVWFRITADDDHYHFYYSENGAKYRLLDSIEKELLSSRIAPGNGPMLVGLYTYTGNIKLQMGYSYADFRYFDLKSW